MLIMRFVLVVGRALYSLSAPSGLSIYPTTGDQSKAVWHVAASGAELGTIPGSIASSEFFKSLAISPDGTRIAYVTQQAADNVTRGRWAWATAKSHRPPFQWIMVRLYP